MQTSSQSLPTGTVTFLFTDIEGSTPLWEAHPEAMKAALARHDSILQAAVAANNGIVLHGAGDGIHAVFESAAHGVAATVAAQQALRQQTWDEIKPQAIRVRMGLHTGEADFRDGDYYGGTLNRAARIMAAGHGGQVLLSSVTAELVRRQLAADLALIDLGEHYLKGLLQAEHIFQVSGPDLARDFPPLNSLSAATNNLPTELTTFIGRELELREMQNKLQSSRLLTLVGPGGTGKTRLAIQIASEQLDRFKDGVWFVELAPLADPAFIASTIAGVFSLREAQGVSLITLIIDYLRGKEVLLLLDNCEHLVEGAARAADQLLRGCPKLKIIASTREALNVDGETVYRVPSLSLPDRASRDLMQYEATRLFIERAAKAEPRFQSTSTNAAAIFQICQRLDGIPLAIELAAARVKLFTPEQIAERLDDRFKLLSGGTRTALPRQQTLRALIDWSYQSLNEVEQRAFRRLAVFSGGWTIEAAEAVIDDPEAIDGLEGLVNKSLVNVVERSGAARYRYLETIRQYALEKLLESDEAVQTRDRHLDYFLKLPGPPLPGLLDGYRPVWLDHMEEEHDNLRAALEWASSHDLPKALRLAWLLGDFWLSRDYNAEAEAWCQTILSRSEDLNEITADRAKLYAVLAQAAIFMGDHNLARPAAEAGLVLAETTGDKGSMVRLNAALGLTCMYLGDLPASSQALRSAEALARELNMNSELTRIIVYTAQMHFFAGGDMQQMKILADEAESLWMKDGVLRSDVTQGFAFARLSGLLGDIEKSRALFKQAAESAERSGNWRVVYSCHSELAHILRRHGDLDEALGLYVQVLPHWKDLGHRSAVAHELECIAFILGQKGRPAQSLTLLGAAEAIRAEIDSSMTKPERLEYEAAVGAFRAQVDGGAFSRAWDAGHAMALDQVVAYALEVAGTSA